MGHIDVDEFDDTQFNTEIRTGNASLSLRVVSRHGDVERYRDRSIAAGGSAMKTILVTGAGGAPALNFTRSLRASPERFHVIGVDCQKYYLQRAETDEKFLVPKADDSSYTAILREIIEETGAQ